MPPPSSSSRRAIAGNLKRQLKLHRQLRSRPEFILSKSKWRLGFNLRRQVLPAHMRQLLRLQSPCFHEHAIALALLACGERIQSTQFLGANTERFFSLKSNSGSRHLLRLSGKSRLLLSFPQTAQHLDNYLKVLQIGINLICKGHLYALTLISPTCYNPNSRHQVLIQSIAVKMERALRVTAPNLLSKTRKLSRKI